MSDERCNCMVLFDPVLPPGEHAEDCPLRHGVMQYRARTDDRPREWWDAPAQDGLWDGDREEVEDGAEVLRTIGATNVRVERRVLLPVAEHVTTGGGADD